MDTVQAMQIIVARADVAVCQLAALPWKRMAASVLLAALAIHVIKAVRNDG